MRSRSVSSLRLVRTALVTTLVSAVLVSLLYSAFFTISLASCTHNSAGYTILHILLVLQCSVREASGLSMRCTRMTIYSLQQQLADQGLLSLACFRVSVMCAGGDLLQLLSA